MADLPMVANLILSVMVSSRKTNLVSQFVFPALQSLNFVLAIDPKIVRLGTSFLKMRPNGLYNETPQKVPVQP